MKLRLTRAQQDADAPSAPRAALRRGQRRRPRGQALVEFALVILPFLTLVFGMLDAGFYLLNGMTVSNAAREGARIAATVPPESRIDSGCGALTCQYTALVQNAVTGAAGNLAVNTDKLQCFGGANWSGVGVSCDFQTVLGSKKGDYVRVTVHYTYTTFFPLFFGASFGASASADMLLEN